MFYKVPHVFVLGRQTFQIDEINLIIYLSRFFYLKIGIYLLRGSALAPIFSMHSLKIENTNLYDAYLENFPIMFLNVFYALHYSSL